jgi:hypothetical protein
MDAGEKEKKKKKEKKGKGKREAGMEGALADSFLSRAGILGF